MGLNGKRNLLISITKKSRSTAGFRQGLCFGPLLLSIMSPVIQFSSITLSVAGPLLAWAWLLSPPRDCVHPYSAGTISTHVYIEGEREWKTLTLTIPRKNHEIHFFYWLRSHSFSWAKHYGHWLVCTSTGTSVELPPSEPRGFPIETEVLGEGEGGDIDTRDATIKCPLVLFTFICFTFCFSCLQTLIFSHLNKFWLLCSAEANSTHNILPTE